MSIKDRIKKIETYFKEMQIVTIDGKQVIYVIVSFPYGWVVNEKINSQFDVTVQQGEYNGEYYFCTEIDNGEEKVFDAIELNIEKMKEAIERAKLLSEKTIQLKKIFEDENVTIDELRNLEISYHKTISLIPNITVSENEVNTCAKNEDKNTNLTSKKNKPEEVKQTNNV